MDASLHDQSRSGGSLQHIWAAIVAELRRESHQLLVGCQQCLHVCHSEVGCGGVDVGVAALQLAVCLCVQHMLDASLFQLGDRRQRWTWQAGVIAASDGVKTNVLDSTTHVLPAASVSRESQGSQARSSADQPTHCQKNKPL